MAKGKKNEEPQDRAKPEETVQNTPARRPANSELDPTKPGQDETADQASQPDRLAPKMAPALRPGQRDKTAEPNAGEGSTGTDGADWPDGPLTKDLDLWAAFRAQRAVARAFANDQDADCFSLEQCQAMVLLIAKSRACPGLALLKHLELSGIKTDLEEPHALFLAEVFRSTFLEGRAYQTRLDALAAPQGPHAPPKIPIEETSLELVDEPLALTETAKRG